MKKISRAVAKEPREAKRLRSLTTACTAAAHAAAAHSAVAQAAAGTEMVYTPLNLTAAVHAAAAAHVGFGHTAPHAIGAGKARPGERIESLAVVQTAATHAATPHAAATHAAATRAGGQLHALLHAPGEGAAPYPKEHASGAGSKRTRPGQPQEKWRPAPAPPLALGAPSAGTLAATPALQSNAPPLAGQLLPAALPGLIKASARR